MPANKALNAQRKWLKTELKYHLACVVHQHHFGTFGRYAPQMYEGIEEIGYKWDGEFWRRGVRAVELAEVEADELPY